MYRDAIWPCHKKVKGHPRILIWTNLIDFSLQCYISRFSLKAFLISGEEDFKRSYNIWVWWPSWSMVQKHLNKLSISLRRKAPCELWWKLIKRFQRRRLKKIHSPIKPDCFRPIMINNRYKIIQIQVIKAFYLTFMAIWTTLYSYFARNLMLFILRWMLKN